MIEAEVGEDMTCSWGGYYGVVEDRFWESTRCLARAIAAYPGSCGRGGGRGLSGSFRSMTSAIWMIGGENVDVMKAILSLGLGFRAGEGGTRGARGCGLMPSSDWAAQHVCVCMTPAYQVHKSAAVGAAAAAERGGKGETRNQRMLCKGREPCDWITRKWAGKMDRK